MAHFTTCYSLHVLVWASESTLLIPRREKFAYFWGQARLHNNFQTSLYNRMKHYLKQNKREIQIYFDRWECWKGYSEKYNQRQVKSDVHDDHTQKVPKGVTQASAAPWVFLVCHHYCVECPYISAILCNRGHISTDSSTLKTRQQSRLGQAHKLICV